MLSLYLQLQQPHSNINTQHPDTISTPVTAYTARIVSPRNKQSTRFHFASMAKAQAHSIVHPIDPKQQTISP